MQLKGTDFKSVPLREPIAHFQKGSQRKTGYLAIDHVVKDAPEIWRYFAAAAATPDLWFSAGYSNIFGE
jgi:hypothetical protein